MGRLGYGLLSCSGKGLLAASLPLICPTFHYHHNNKTRPTEQLFALPHILTNNLRLITVSHSLITLISHPIMLIHEVWPQLWLVVLISLPTTIDWSGLGCQWFLKCQIKSSKHHRSFFLLLGSARKCVVIVSAPLTYLNCVCLGWRRVGCWDFNLLTEPSAAVIGLHITGIK